MEEKFGPYIFSKRTEYSKIQVFDESGNNISKTSYGSKLLDDYIICKNSIKKSLNIEEDTLLSYADDLDIENVFLPKSMSIIDRYAFEKSSMKRVFIPEGVTDIELGAFFKANNLEEAYFPDSIKDLTKSCVFMDCHSLHTVRLPSHIVSIPHSMFCRCYELTNITLPETIRYIETCAFDCCSSLQRITLPDSTIKIAEDAFSGCVKLTKINIPKNLERLGGRVFADSGIETLIFNHSFKDTAFDKDQALKYSNIKRIEIDSNVEYIKPSLFLPIQNKIEKIVFKGSEKEFKKFKKENCELFKMFPNIDIDILYKDLDNTLLPVGEKSKSFNIDSLKR